MQTFIEHAHTIQSKLSLLLRGFPDYPAVPYCDAFTSRRDAIELHLAIDDLQDTISKAAERDRQLEAYSRDTEEVVRRLVDALGPDGDGSLGDILADLITSTARLIHLIDPTASPAKQEPAAVPEVVSSDDPYYPAIAYEGSNISADTLRQAAHKGRIRYRKGNGNLNHYRDADVRKCWPHLF